MRWRIHYVGGSTFSSADGRWEDAPVEGVQVVMEWPEDAPKRIHSGTDFYLHHSEELFSGDLPPLGMMLLAGHFGPALKTGELTPDEDYESVLAEARTAEAPGA